MHILVWDPALARPKDLDDALCSKDSRDISNRSALPRATGNPQRYPDLLPCLSVTAIWVSFRDPWMMDGSACENRVAALRAFVRTRADVSEGDLDRLVACLRSADQSRER
jgi:hypothetical protein